MSISKLINFSSFLGFTDSMKPMQKAKVENTLNENIQSNGVIMTRKEWVYNKLQAGLQPEVEHDAWHWKKNGEKSKPTTIYKLQYDGGYFKIKKTEYDFTIHILNNNLHNSGTLNEFLQVEQQKADEQARIATDQRAAEQAAYEAKQQEEEQFKQWLNNEIASYNNQQKIELYLSIFNDAYPDRPASTLQAKTFLVLVENINVPQCRQELKERLHVGNPTSKKIFYHITGRKLPNTNKGTMALLDELTINDYHGSVPYKTKNNNEGMNEFYIYIPSDNDFAKSYGQKIEYKGITGFIVSNVVYEAKSGVTIAREAHGMTVEEAFQRVIDNHGVEKINELIDKQVSMNGISTLYNSSAAVEPAAIEEPVMDEPMSIQTTSDYFKRSEESLKEFYKGSTVETNLIYSINDDVNIKHCDNLHDLRKEEKRMKSDGWRVQALLQTIDNKYVLLAV